MIKQNSRDLKYYKYSKLYLDEINDLPDIIQENGFKYKITINNFELENREEIEKFSEKSRKIWNIYKWNSISYRNCRNFFVRQKDSIVLSLLSVIIGSLLTLLVELIIRKIN